MDLPVGARAAAQLRQRFLRHHPFSSLNNQVTYPTTMEPQLNPGKKQFKLSTFYKLGWSGSGRSGWSCQFLINDHKLSLIVQMVGSVGSRSVGWLGLFRQPPTAGKFDSVGRSGPAVCSPLYR